MDINKETSAMYTHPELLLVADTVAREKSIDREEVLEAMEQAIHMAMNMIFALKLIVKPVKLNWPATSKWQKKLKIPLLKLPWMLLRVRRLML